MGPVDDEQDAARADMRAAVRKTRDGAAARLAAAHRMKEAHLPISEIARIAEVSKPTIYRWMNEGETK